MVLDRSFAVLAFCAALYGADTKDVTERWR